MYLAKKFFFGKVFDPSMRAAAFVGPRHRISAAQPSARPCLTISGYPHLHECSPQSCYQRRFWAGNDQIHPMFSNKREKGWEVVWIDMVDPLDLLQSSSRAFIAWNYKTILDQFWLCKLPRKSRFSSTATPYQEVGFQAVETW